MIVLTPNTLKSTDLGVIGSKLVTWVKEKSLRKSNIALSTYQYRSATRVTKLVGVS